jgi:glycosyltransferase involved in cell wall biosynthesis
MSNLYKVSILIPVYNRDKLIEETVNSALNQTYHNIEIIIVDNKSTDNTWTILNNISRNNDRVKIFRNESNIGPVKNWKRCIDEASGEYGKILWSDDLIAPNFVKNTIDLLKHSDVGFVFTGVGKFTDNLDKINNQYFIGKTGIYDSDMYINKVLFEENYPVSPGCALFRIKDLKKNLLIQIPNKIGSDFSMHAIGNDLLLFLLTAQIYNKFAFVNERLAYFRDHDGSISNKNSNSGKLSFYYNIAAAYYVENYRSDLIEKLNSRIWLTIIKYSEYSKYNNLNMLMNYYLYNNNYSINYNYIVRILHKKFVHLAVSKMKNIIQNIRWY